MKTFYIIDENVEFYSEDKKVRYKALSGNALHVFWLRIREKKNSSARIPTVTETL